MMTRGGTLAGVANRRLCRLVNMGQVAPARALAVAVLIKAAADEDETFFKHSDGEFWADMAGLRPSVLRRYVARLLVDNCTVREYNGDATSDDD